MDLKILTSAVDKARLLGKVFSQNSNLDDINVPLPDFPLRTFSSLSEMNITAKDVNFFISLPSNFKSNWT